MTHMNPGTLYLVATPIGNLKDITLRALEVLREVDLIAAEDTRNTRKLLSHYNIKTQLISYHDHVELTKAGHLIDELKKGKTIALVSDSGTPLISDPGFNFVRKALEENIEIISIPGPSAFVSGLIVSGFPIDRFQFLGYVSRNPSKRRKEIHSIGDVTYTIVLYESPHRILKTFKDLLDILGNRRIAVMRELTKKFEEHFRGTIKDAIAHFTQKGVRGEFVIVLEGKK